MQQSLTIELDQHFLQAVPVLKKIMQAGYEAYFVGGSVRDAVLQLENNDIDIATSAFPNEIKDIFNKTIDLGIEHGTVLVLYQQDSYEVTTFRTEEGYADFRRPDQVNFVRSLKEDLKRRDFTMNALAMDAFGRVTDLFDGINDIDHQLIRAVGKANERFHEDALRMMRALRFQSQLQFHIEEETFQALTDLAHLLDHIAVERIHVEFIKLMQGQGRSQALASFVSSGIYRYCPVMETKAQSLKDLQNFSLKLKDEASIWAIIAYYFKLDEKDLKSFLKQWKCSNETINHSQAIYKGLLYRLNHPWSKPVLYQLGYQASQQAEYLLSGLNRPVDFAGLEAQWTAMPIYSKKDLAIDGGHILAHTNLPPGPWLGQLLSTIEDQVLNQQLDNNKEDLLAFVDHYISQD